MSHVVDFNPDSVEQKLRNINALKIACDTLGLDTLGEPALELVLPPGALIGSDGLIYDSDGQLILKGNLHYRTWETDHGRLAGDWPLPAGMKANEVGKNATAVIKLRGKALDMNPTAYEIGLIPRVDSEGNVTYSMCHDFFAGGYGLENYVGKTVMNGKKVQEAHGDLLMFYQMACARMAAEEAGHSCEFQHQQDGTYVAIVDKECAGITA